MHAPARGGAKRARIEIIPLIDIIFFLLATFIMVSLSMSKNQGIQVSVPTTSAAAPLTTKQELDKALTLSVNARGEVFYNKDKITIAQLPLRLQTYAAMAKDDARVIVNGDSTVPYQYVVNVINEVKEAGIKKVGLNTEKR